MLTEFCPHYLYSKGYCCSLHNDCEPLYSLYLCVVILLLTVQCGLLYFFCCLFIYFNHTWNISIYIGNHISEELICLIWWLFKIQQQAFQFRNNYFEFLLAKFSRLWIIESSSEPNFILKYLDECQVTMTLMMISMAIFLKMIQS